jgi:serine/threonine-protein kinase
LDPLALIRSLVPATHQDVLVDALQRFPVGRFGAIHPRLVPHLVAAGALDLGALIEAVSDLPVVPDPSAPGGAPRFMEVALLGKGGMGAVDLVHDRVLARYMARKTLHASAATSADSRDRFRNEAAITAQLDHPSIVSVYELDDPGSRPPSYTMKLVRGRTLEDLINDARRAAAAGRPERFTLQERLGVFLDVCDAMAYAHARRIVHRDLKPENIMVGRFNQVLVMDWGVARLMGRSEAPMPGMPEHDPDGDGTRTAAGTAIGTPVYMSPEQARGENEELDGRSDLYTLGLILFELVTLQRGRGGRHTIEILYAAMDGERRPVRHAVKGHKVPRGLAAIVEKATQVDPARRYQRVDELADDVRRFLRDEPVLARPDSLTQSLGRWVARHRMLTVVAVLGLLLAVVGIALLGVAGSVVVNEVNRWSAQAREARIEEVRSAVDSQAWRIQAELLRVEGSTRGVVAATEQALRAPAPDVVAYLDHLFEDPATAPVDLASGPPWDSTVSLEQIDLVVAPGASVADEDLRRLASLAPMYRSVMVASWGDRARGLDDAGVRALLLSEGAPLIWVYSATESGVAAGFPGVGSEGYPDDYDARERPWYQAAMAADDIVWSALDADEGGLGLLLTCAGALRDPQGRKIGVAAVDLTFGRVIDTLLEPPGLPPSAEAWLIDADGRVVVRSSQKAFATEVPEHWAPPSFPHPELLQTLRSEGPAGVTEVDLDGTPSLALWRAIDGVSWTYLVTGPTGELL